MVLVAHQCVERDHRDACFIPDQSCFGIRGISSVASLAKTADNSWRNHFLLDIGGISWAPDGRASAKRLLHACAPIRTGVASRSSQSKCTRNRTIEVSCDRSYIARHSIHLRYRRHGRDILWSLCNRGFALRKLIAWRWPACSYVYFRQCAEILLASGCQ